MSTVVRATPRPVEHVQDGSSDAAPSRLPTPTPTPDCGQTGMREDSAPPGYSTDPRAAEGRNHIVFGAGPLTTLADRDAFRSSLPIEANMARVNDAIARGCSAAWIRDHLDRSTTTALP
jgi:hypothetical protein